MSNRKKRYEQKSTKKSGSIIWGGLAVLIIVIAGGIWMFTQNASDTNAATPGTLSAAGNSASEWGLGNPDAALRIDEFGDYQCGACAFYHPIIKEVLEEFGDEIYFVWNHFPLINAHQFAVLAASATEAAGRQGQFWEMHDLIMRNQQAWARGMASSAFLSYARQLGLDDEQFLKDVRDEEILNKIEDQYNQGRALSIRAVPSFFFNGVYTEVPGSAAGFKAVIAQKLAELE
jgi:protein-disulfide isomerase